MKCANCGAEIPNTSNFCEYCGSQISVEMKKEQEQLKKEGCPKCGSSNIAFNREKTGEVRGKKGTSVIRSTVGVCGDCGYTWTTTDETKKRKTWLWVLGWIFIFPVPLTIILLRKNGMKPAVKYGIIAAIWLIYLIIGFSGRDDTEQIGTDYNSTVSVVETAKDDNVTIEKETVAGSDLEKIEISIDPNVNSDDGTVLFGITADLPEDTKLIVTLTNSAGYNESDTITILKNGTGYTSEFEDNGKGLNGEYEVTVSDKEGNVLAAEKFNFVLEFDAEEKTKTSSESTEVSLAAVTPTEKTTSIEEKTSAEETASVEEEKSAEKTTSTGTTSVEEEKESYVITEINKTMYVVSTANVRSEPDKDSNKLGTLSFNDEVSVTGQVDNGWYRIDYNGNAGFMKGSLLSSEKKVVQESQSSGGGNSDSNSDTNSDNNAGSGNGGGSTGVIVPTTSDTEGNLVWVPQKGGTKYHTKSTCSNMDNPIQITREHAEANGYTACKRCYK